MLLHPNLCPMTVSKPEYGVILLLQCGMVWIRIALTDRTREQEDKEH